MSEPTRIPILFDFAKCECCGRPIYQPGMCPVCAAMKTSVDHVVRVISEVPDEKLIQPEDLRDEQAA